MKKIICLHVSAELGGSEKCFLELISSLDFKSNSNAPDPADLIIVLPWNGPLANEILRKLPQSHIHILSFPNLFSKGTRKFPLKTLLKTIFALPQILFYLYKLNKLISSYSPSVIYSNGIKCHVLSALLCFLKPMKVVWHMQDYFPSFKYVKAFFSFIKFKPNAIICNSSSVLRDLTDHYPQWKDNAFVIHNAVDLNIYKPSDLSQKSLFKSNDDFTQTKSNSSPRSDHPLTISMIGILTPWKGQDVFIRTISLLHQEYPHLEFRAMIVGDEIYKTQGESGFKNRLIGLANELKIQNIITFMGFVKNVEMVYNQSDIVIHCSIKPEPFGRVVVESMASGCCTIGADAGGVRELIKNEITGFLVPTNSPEEIKNAIAKILKEPTLRKEIILNARKHVEENFSAKIFSEKIFTVLNKEIKDA